MDSKLKKYIIACAGAGKTTLLINETIKRSENETVLITTFTDANERSIKNKLIKKLGFIPQNIKIKTWFSFLIENGVKERAVAVEIIEHKNIGDSSAEKYYTFIVSYYSHYYQKVMQFETTTLAFVPEDRQNYSCNVYEAQKEVIEQ